MAIPDNLVSLFRRSTIGSGAGGPAIMLLFAATMFLGAALLFWIQPMFVKMVLPLLGGSPSVWSTAMVFFQAAVLAGYAYAHWLARRFSPKSQLLIHLPLLSVAFLFLPISVAAGMIPDAETIPVLWLLGLLAASIGPPFLAVSATAPLMQRWFSHSRHPHAADPYFLYGASNLGSILGLLGFPLILAPLLSLHEQSLAWTGAFGALAALIAISGLLIIRRRPPAPAAHNAPPFQTLGHADWRARVSWVAYSAVPSALLLGVTGHITTDIAAVPLLWVMPLVLYLLTFVIAFARRSIVSRGLVLRAFPFAVVLLVSISIWLPPVSLSLPLHLLVFLVIALMCHGELARRRPEVSSLTEFYVWISLGGLLGGSFTAVLAPVVFDGVYEYPIAIIIACTLLPATHSVRIRGDDILFALLAFGAIFAFNAIAVELSPDRASKLTGYFAALLVLLAFGRKARPLGFAMAIAAVLTSTLAVMESDRTLMRDRSFFGVYRVAENDSGTRRVLVHGTTLHGGQRLLADGTVVPIAYHASDSPVAEVIRSVQAVTETPSIGIVGLGAGALACYRRPSEDWRFFEIDPLVVRIATDGRYFGMMPNCAADAPIIIGDARLTLTREPAGRFDLLVVDVFSSDAIPMHLLTREALALYVSRLREDGVIILHISNRFLDLRPIVAKLTADQGLVAHVGTMSSDTVDSALQVGPRANAASIWVLIAREPKQIDRLGLGHIWSELGPSGRNRVWSDDYSNILEAIRF